MPNFRGTHFGLATRISIRPSKNPAYFEKLKHLFVEAVPLEYGARGGEEGFLAQWPAGAHAHRSYYGRIVNGPRYAVEQALRRARTGTPPVAPGGRRALPCSL